MGLRSTVPPMGETKFNYAELGIAALGLIGATYLAATSALDGQQAISIYTLVFGYVFGRTQG